MLRLYILRHAKSSWALPGITDFNRGLNDRGNRDLAKIAKMMVEKSFVPQQVYCSSAVRTSKTIEGIRSEIQKSELHKNPSRMPVEYIENLYSGTIDSYLNVIKSHHDNHQSLMLVGHNPTCHGLTSLLIADGGKKALADLSYNFPTGALAVIDIEADRWADIKKQTGYLQDFVLPRKLPSL